ncbi:MAG: tryptophan synthase subunit alpha, partial [Myxococcota bacterium]
EGLLETLQKERFDIPLLLMSYLNPLLAQGDRLVPEMEKAGVSGLVVPDLPLEEGDEIDGALAARQLAWVQLIAPTTPRERARQLAAASRGFVYAVTSRGQTGGDARLSDELTEQLADLKAAAKAPVLVGFGVRRRAQVELFSGHADGVIVGSALMDTILKDEDPIAFLKTLRGLL